MVNINKLRNKIKSQKLSQNYIAFVLGTSANTVRNKLYGKTELTIEEANRLADILRLSDEEKLDIFFS